MHLRGMPVSPTPTSQLQDPFGNSTSSLFPAAAPFNQQGYFYDPHEQNPMSLQWNFGLKRLLGESTTMTMNHVGSSGRRLTVGSYYNRHEPDLGSFQPIQETGRSVSSAIMDDRQLF